MRVTGEAWSRSAIRASSTTSVCAIPNGSAIPLELPLEKTTAPTKAESSQTPTRTIGGVGRVRE